MVAAGTKKLESIEDALETLDKEIARMNGVLNTIEAPVGLELSALANAETVMKNKKAAVEAIELEKQELSKRIKKKYQSFGVPRTNEELDKKKIQLSHSKRIL